MSAPATTEHQDGRRHSGCLMVWLTGALARFVLVYPLAVMGSACGQRLQELLLTQAGTAYEGALGGAAVGGVVGVILAWRGLMGGGWHGGVADAALCLSSALWLLGLGALVIGGINEAEITIIWAAGVIVPLFVAVSG